MAESRGYIDRRRNGINIFVTAAMGYSTYFLRTRDSEMKEIDTNRPRLQKRDAGDISSFIDYIIICLFLSVCP